MIKVVSTNGVPVIGDMIVNEALVFIDTETSDNIKHGITADHPSQPWLAEIAMRFLVLANEKWTIVGGYHAFVRPNAFWKMSPEATRINGITDEFLHRGIPVSNVLERWENVLQGGFIPAAFNFGFDGKIMRGAMRRSGRPDYRATPYVDTMLDANAHIKAKTPKGRPKFPTLNEACRFYSLPLVTGFGTPNKAIRDVDALVAIFLAMVDKGHPWTRREYINPAKPQPNPTENPTRRAPSDKADYRPPHPRQITDMPAHRQPTKRG
jgi:DNA polymerase III epsilon subunit-like protein